jgi:methionyl-tRNA formyltransferase
VLKTVIFTTETTHHLYYVWKLQKLCLLEAVILETNSLQAGFPTTHPFEKDRENFEKNEVLKEAPGKIADIVPVSHFKSVNESSCVDKIKELAPDIIIIFGTGRVSAEVISLPAKACLNLHGGPPEHYRGLDSHLWAIYHNDFQNLITTLHCVEPTLDTGSIVFEQQLHITRDTSLEKLRIVNTEACINMSALAISALRENGYLPSRLQLEAGRYYSFMPYALKEVCVRKYNRYLKKIK